jgi:hypothetical protein
MGTIGASYAGAFPAGWLGHGRMYPGAPELTSNTHRLMPIVGVALATLMLVGCDNADSTASPTASPIPVASEPASVAASASAPASAAAGEGDETSVFDLATGDCFDASGDEVDTVTVIECDSAHMYEAFAIFDHEAGADAPYPGDDALLEYADSACQPYFEDYVGIAYADSEYWITSVTPSQQTWDDSDDREIVCALKLGEEAQETTGSAEGTGR